ncbi:TIGR01212 family radical SAM protein [bacterium D16-51]|nr:TIGR01212 family radical SAM protein [bacterium D16-59]RKI59782.1 TIGR01212 family radical SAM protein [bacterium D16-51]
MPLKNISNRNNKLRWGEKPYYSLDYYLKEQYGQKVYKLALDAGMSCPNRDGTLGTQGCIFCSGGGSGEFATPLTGSCPIQKQIDQAIAFLTSRQKYTGKAYIAYLQSFSNTYAPIEKLQKIYHEILKHPKIACMSVGTRPDCFSEETYHLLEKCSHIKPVWIELGLQTIHESTAQFIRRGYSLPVFEKCVQNLQKRKIPVIVHIILGLPGESEQDILETVGYLNELGIQGIKFQLLHILKGTGLAKMLPELKTYSQDEYISVLLKCIAHLSPDIVIHRLTGDGPKELLLAPDWSQNKRNVLNQIAHTMKEQNIYQGKEYRQKGGSL